MNIKDSYNNTKFTFNMQDGLEDRIDRLTVMMSELTTKDKGLNKQFKPKIYQGRGRGQSRIFKMGAIIISEVVKIGIDQIVETGEFN